MIRKVLIANRGEIACRIIRTLDKLGIASVAVFSEADRHALHVELATESIFIGAAPASESYLCIEKVVAAAMQCNADAVHPGYGFLSENPALVRALEKQNIIFIGPDAGSIEAMGLKDAAKARMVEAGVPVVPGYHGDNQDAGFLVTQAEEIGYPVLVKARAGGGGKGMRKVDGAGDFAAALASAKRESSASFGDDSVLIEKFVSSPRHIEVQVFGDRHGNVVHLYERDCSLQRRHQKVIEEAPAPGMTTEMRDAMGSAAVAAARAVNYVGAGTVEFIVDASEGLRADRFYFMEMNTRLQVEHPVTEAITGTDLVAWQIAVAAGKPLPLTQEQIPLKGHAFEARIYAEDADNNFLPVIGTLSHLWFSHRARIDTGVRQGDSISPFYDPMIAKLIVAADSREQALQSLKMALSETRIGGSTTNMGFLGRLCDAEEFVLGKATTALIENNQDTLKRPDALPRHVKILTSVLLAGSLPKSDHSALGWQSPWQSLTGFRNWGCSEIHGEYNYHDRQISYSVRIHSSQQLEVSLDDSDVAVEIIRLERDNLSGTVDLEISGLATQLSWSEQDDKITVYHAGESWVIVTPDPLEVEKNAGISGNDIVAPMPGNIIMVAVQAGDSVSEGDILVQMEAMKMEHTLVAERSAVIAVVNVKEAEQIEAGAVLLRFEE